MKKQNDKLVPGIILGLIGLTLVLQGLNLVDLGLGEVGMSFETGTNINPGASVTIGQNYLPRVMQVSMTDVFGSNAQSKCNAYLAANNKVIVANLLISYEGNCKQGCYSYDGVTIPQTTEKFVDFKELEIKSCSYELPNFIGVSNYFEKFKASSDGQFTFTVEYQYENGQPVDGIKSEDFTLGSWNPVKPRCSTAGYTDTNTFEILKACDCEGLGSSRTEGYCKNGVYSTGVCSASMTFDPITFKCIAGTVNGDCSLSQYQNNYKKCDENKLLQCLPAINNYAFGIVRVCSNGCTGTDGNAYCVVSTPSATPSTEPGAEDCQKSYNGLQALGNCEGNEPVCVDGLTKVCQPLNDGDISCWFITDSPCDDDNGLINEIPDGVCSETENCANSDDCACGDGLVCDTNELACTDQNDDNKGSDDPLGLCETGEKLCYSTAEKNTYCADSCESGDSLMCDKYPNSPSCKKSNGSSGSSANNDMLFLILGGACILGGAYFLMKK